MKINCLRATVAYEPAGADGSRGAKIFCEPGKSYDVSVEDARFLVAKKKAAYADERNAPTPGVMKAADSGLVKGGKKGVAG